MEDFKINHESSINDDIENGSLQENNENSGIKNVRKADLVTSFILFAFGLYMLKEAIKMPVKEVTGSDDLWYIAPGVFPGFIAILIIISSMILFFYSYKQSDGICKEDIKNIQVYLKSNTFLRLCIALGLLIFYVFVMVGRVRYELATLIYLFTTMFIFKNQRASIKFTLKILAICIITTFAVSYGFSHFAQIPLP